MKTASQGPLFAGKLSSLFPSEYLGMLKHYPGSRQARKEPVKAPLMPTLDSSVKKIRMKQCLY
jgi:hypothetical protein